MLKGKIKNIVSLCLVLLFLLPSVIKLEHQHHHSSVCHEDNHNHIREHHEKCYVCVFEFQIFTSDVQKFRISTDAPVTEYRSGQHLLIPEINKPFSFFLRGPPVAQI